MEEYPEVEVSGSGEVNTKCWECGVCSRTNPPSARRCMREGCGMVREGGLKGGEKAVEVKTKAQEIKVVPSR